MSSSNLTGNSMLKIIANRCQPKHLVMHQLPSNNNIAVLFNINKSSRMFPNVAVYDPRIIINQRATSEQALLIDVLKINHYQSNNLKICNRWACKSWECNQAPPLRSQKVNFSDKITKETLFTRRQNQKQNFHIIIIEQKVDKIIDSNK